MYIPQVFIGTFLFMTPLEYTKDISLQLSAAIVISRAIFALVFVLNSRS